MLFITHAQMIRILSESDDFNRLLASELIIALLVCEKNTALLGIVITKVIIGVRRKHCVILPATQ